MSFSYDRYERRQSSRRTTFGFWVPLVLTVTVATAGAVAWVWSERREDEESSDDENLSYGEDRDGKVPGASRESLSTGVVHEDESLMGRVQGVLRRTPSPQQFMDTVSKKTVAGVAAAGAAVGGVLASIREEDKDDYGDHNRWSEEAAMRRNVEAQSSQSAGAVDTHSKSFASSVRGGPSSSGRRKTVALVVSAESLMDDPLEQHEGSYRSENATILSHLPDTDFNTTKLFVLIYSPSLRSRPNSGVGAPSLGSSYSAISTPAQTPGEELSHIDPQPEATVYTPALSARSSDNVLWNTLHAQALRLVENPAMVMPFTTPNGFVHMLRHLGPELVYVVDALSGTSGSNISDIKRWVGQTIVVVGSDGTGLGGLVDTDDEGPAGKSKSEHAHGQQWWESADMVGLGKGVEVVDASRLTEDFERRVAGRD